MNDLNVEQRLTGKEIKKQDEFQFASKFTLWFLNVGTVTNVVPFGLMVDIGLEKNALLHQTEMNGMSLDSFTIGDQLQVRIAEIDVHVHRITLKLDV